MVFQLPSMDPSPIMSGLYETDLYNQMPIFLIKKNINYFVRSWEEAFALHGNPSLEDINPNYLKALIYGENSSLVSPYKSIIRIPKASQIYINSDFTYKLEKKQLFEINNLNKNKDEIHDNITSILIRNLKKIIDNKKENIGCELSGGLDSNTIVGVLKKENLTNSRNLYTFSNAVHGELDLINLAIKHHNIDKKNFFIYEKFNSISEIDFDEVRKMYLNKLGFIPQMGILPVGLNKFKEFEVKLVFSGFGGDQCLSHHGLNIATDYIENLQLSRLNDFYDKNFDSVKKLIFRLMYMANPGFMFLKKLKFKNKYENFLNQFLTSKSKNLFNKKNKRLNNWEENYYCNLKKSIVNRISADWVSLRTEEETRIYKSFGIRKYYPFLNKELISYILSLNLNNVISMPFAERSIIKIAFKKYIPEEIINNNKNQINKSEILENLKITLLEDIIQNFNHLNNLHEKIYEVFNVNKLKNETSKLLNKPGLLSIYDLIEIRRGLGCLNSLSFWFHSLS